MLKFFKRYGYYVLAFALILAVGITAGLTGANGEPSVVPDEPSTPTQTTKVEMLSPMENPEVLKWYSDTELFYNATLKQWESHKAVDLSSANTSVYSVLDGVISGCSYDYENGYCLTIEHGDGLKTMYCSLASTDGLKKGDSVKRGQKIGDASTSSASESSDGNHLHFSVELNGNSVDPASYLTFENK